MVYLDYLGDRRNNFDNLYTIGATGIHLSNTFYREFPLADIIFLINSYKKLTTLGDKIYIQGNSK